MNFRAHLWRLSRLLNSAEKVASLASASGRPVVKFRKSKLRRVLDLAYIALRWEEYSTAYYAQGGDEVGVSVRRDLITVGQFNKARSRLNKNSAFPDEGYSVVFEDKLLFERYFSGLGLPVVRSFGLLFPALEYLNLERNEKFDLRHGTPPEEFKDAFCKPLAGRYGNGAFRVWCKNNEILTRGGTKSGFEALEVAIPYLVQERIVQHPDISKFHESSLNTIRLVSCIGGRGEVCFLGGFFRMGVAGGVVDNASAGGVICGVNVQTGVLDSLGYQLNKTSAIEIEEHPTSGVFFKDIQLPWFREILDIVRRAHGLAPWIRSVGWDVAITPSGPLLIEGNQRWGPLSMSWIDSKFMQKALEKLSVGQ